MRQIEEDTAAMLRATEAAPCAPSTTTHTTTSPPPTSLEEEMRQIEEDTAAMLLTATEPHDDGVVSLEQLLAPVPDLGVLCLEEEEAPQPPGDQQPPTATAGGLREMLFGRTTAGGSNAAAGAAASSDPEEVRTADEVRAKYGRPRQASKSEAAAAAAEARDRLAERGEKLSTMVNVSERMERDASSMAKAARKLADRQKSWFGL
jgi:hypothetical protein